MRNVYQAIFDVHVVCEARLGQEFARDTDTVEVADIPDFHGFAGRLFGRHAVASIGRRPDVV